MANTTILTDHIPTEPGLRIEPAPSRALATGSIQDLVAGMMEEMKVLSLANTASQPSASAHPSPAQSPPGFNANEPQEGLHPVDRMIMMVHGLYLHGTTLLQHYLSGAGDKGDLNEAVQALGGAFNMSSPKHPQLPTYLLALGKALTVMFHADSANPDREVRIIDDAISFLTRCVDMTEDDEDRPDRQEMLNRLGEAYTERFNHLKNPDDLASATQCIRRAIDVTPPEHEDLFLMYFSLGTTYLMRYNELGDLNGLGEAAVSLEKAIDLAPVGTARLPLMLVMRGKALEERFERMLDTRDIDEAILCARRALNIAIQGHDSDLRIVQYQDYLTQLLGHRWQHTNQDADIEEIGKICNEALAQMKPTDEDYIRYVMTAASWLIAHYRQNNDIKHIDESITLFDVASQGTEKDDPAYMIILGNSANARLMRYDHLHDIADLNAVISVLQTAIDILLPHRQELVEWREKLGSAYRFRYDALSNIEDLQEAASQYRQAAMFTMGTQRHRAVSARMWAIVAERLGDTVQSLEAYQLAVELGTLLTGLERSMDQRRVYLEEAHKLGLYIAAKALEKGEVERAVVWLEQGRGLLWRQLQHVRSPADGLEAEHPELAQRVRELSRRLEEGELLSVSPASEAKVGGDMHWTLSMPREVRRVLWKDNESTARFGLVLEWENLLREVRQKQGFETFLRPQPIEDTTDHLPHEGLTILLHAHEEGSYAIIIDRDSKAGRKARLRSMPLRDFTFAKGEATVRRLRTILEAAGLRGSGEEEEDLPEANDPTRALTVFARPTGKQNTIASVLEELWDCVVKPVVEYLDLKPSTNSSEKTRIWWCATGPLAFLPIHAAGAYEPAVFGSALVDYAISSYTPTLAALAKLVQDQAPTSSSSLGPAQQAGLLIISHSDVPGLPKLPGTIAEVAAIRALFDEPNRPVNPIVHLNNRDATTTAARDMIASQRFDMVHFACHANQDRRNPLKSGFSLEDGKLTLADIIRRRDESMSTSKSSMALAFLSACQTSTETESFSEEAVHLVAGMLAAGYRGVVGTLWGIPDRYAPVIAEEFYRRLVSRDAPGLDAAHALHCATEKLRVELGHSEEAHLAWIPFVHFGL